MRSSSSTVAFALALLAVSAPLGAQTAPLTRAMQLETDGKLREAAGVYRDALTAGDVVPALLGLERIYTQLGWDDTLVVVARGVLRTHPGEPTARTVHLRALHTLKRHADARAAFVEWTRAVPGDIEPYRAWSQLLLADNRVATVDSILQEAQRTFGDLRGLTLEIAQLRAALGQWDQAAVSWRDVVTRQDHLETAAAFSLRNAPPESRRLVRAVLMSPPVQRAPRKLLAALELGWENGREGWRALSELPLDDSTVVIWQSFADDADKRGQYLAARDALVALERWRPDARRALRAASMAVSGGDPESGLTLAAEASQRLGPKEGPRSALLVRLEAYALLRRGQDAQREFSALEASLPDGERASMRRLVAWAWVRSGHVAEARAMLGNAMPNPDDELTGWLALYDGNLEGARRGLRRVDTRDADAVFAASFVSRTRVDTAPLTGQAFLAIARGDSLNAPEAFVRAAQEVEDAASVLLLAAARIHLLQKREPQATDIWKQLVEKHGTTPEAAEAELEWARLLRRQGDARGAIAHLEHLILTWPQSALLPQARHELGLARAQAGGSDDV